MQWMTLSFFFTVNNEDVIDDIIIDCHKIIKRIVDFPDKTHCNLRLIDT